MGPCTRTLLHELPGAAGLRPGDPYTLPARSRRIVLWNAHRRVPDGDPLTGFTLAVGAAAFSADGAAVAATDADHGIRVFDLVRRRQVGTPLGLDAGKDFPIDFLPDSQLLTSCTAMGVWDVGLADVAARHRGCRSDPPKGLRALCARNSRHHYRTARRGRACGGGTSRPAARGSFLPGEARDFFSISPDSAAVTAPLYDRSGTGILEDIQRRTTGDPRRWRRRGWVAAGARR